MEAKSDSSVATADDLVFAFCQKHTEVPMWAIEELAQSISKAVAYRCAEIADADDGDGSMGTVAGMAIRLEFNIGFKE